MWDEQENVDQYSPLVARSIQAEFINGLFWNINILYAQF